MKLVRYNTPSLATWTPFDRMSSLRDLLDSAFALAGSGPSVAGERGWEPVLDVFEDADKITVKVEVPGMKKEDFDISLKDDVLTISGERSAESEKKEGESFRSERFFGKFTRSLSLPSSVRGENVNATYQDGILTLELPKAEESKPRKIDVRLN